MILVQRGCLFGDAPHTALCMSSKSLQTESKPRCVFEAGVSKAHEDAEEDAWSAGEDASVVAEEDARISHVLHLVRCIHGHL